MAITVSVMQGGASNHPTTSTEANGLTTDFVTTGVIGTFTNTSGVAPTTGAFSVNAQGTPDMTVAVGSGVAYVAGTPASQLAQKFRVYNSASANTTISANASGSTKYDWVYIKLDATLLNAPTLAGDTTATIVTSRSTSQSADDGTPPTYGYAIAVVTVANGAVSITNSVIRDVRNAADIGVIAGTNTGWTTGALPVVSSVTENGNRSASIAFASTVASILTPGTRIRTNRTVVAPTGAILLNGTTQYASKTTPANMAQTDDISPFGWIRLISYPGARATINSKFSGSGTNNGWIFSINASGQVVIEGYNTSTTRSVTSYQSIPLNKWVHVTASLDLSGWTTATNKIMIDGVDVPVSLVNGAGTPASFVSAGNYDVGCYNTAVAAAGFFTGNLAQVGFFNGNVSTITQATLRGYKNQTMSGSETSIIAAHKLDQASGLNDLTANANNLTATGSPTYSVASPFTTDANGVPGGTYDWAIVTKVATTVATVQYPEGCAIPTSGGISTVDYSGVKAPFGMPVSEGRWTLDTLGKVQASQVTAVAGTWYQLGNIQMSVPVGEWVLTYNVGVQQNGTAGGADVTATLATTTAAETDTTYTAQTSASSAIMGGVFTKTNNVSLNIATNYFLNSKNQTALAANTLYNRGDTSPTTIRAKLAYL